MTQKIIDVRDIEALQRFTVDHRGLPFIEQDGNWIAHNDLRALLDKAPSVSGEAVALMDSVGVCAITLHMAKELDARAKEGFPYDLWPTKLYTTPQPDRVAELEATNKKLLELLGKAFDMGFSCSGEGRNGEYGCDDIEVNIYYQNNKKDAVDNLLAIAEAEGK